MGKQYEYPSVGSQGASSLSTTRGAIRVARRHTATRARAPSRAMTPKTRDAPVPNAFGAAYASCARRAFATMTMGGLAHRGATTPSATATGGAMTTFAASSANEASAGVKFAKDVFAGTCGGDYGDVARASIRHGEGAVADAEYEESSVLGRGGCGVEGD